MSIEIDQSPTLMLICTPFQAWVASNLPREQMCNPIDLLYLTRFDSMEDRVAYKTISTGKRLKQYIYVPKRRPDILNHILGNIKIPRWVWRNYYKTVWLSSIETPTICAVTNKHRDAQLLTFDDGIGNILRTSTFQRDPAGMRMRLYRKLLGAPSPDEMRQRIKRHFTIYQGFENIVDKERLTILPRKNHRTLTVSGNPIRYFIGQPFEFVLSKEQRKRLATAAKAWKPDFYVRHPREKKPLFDSVPELEKNGQIAEEAILRHAGSRPIEIAGLFSSVMANLQDDAQQVLCMLPNEHPQTSEQNSVASRLGLKVEFI